jgi:hypothetical protein
MEINVDEKLLAKKKEAYRRGVAVIILLLFLTAGEYWLGSIAYDWWAIIFAIALLKAFFVLRDYMHVGRLFTAEEEA